MPRAQSRLTQDFLAELEGFLRRQGLTPTSFGRTVMGDPGFVAALKKGRCPTARTIDFVRAHIADQEK